MKKTFALILCFALVCTLFLVGCQEEEEEELSVQDWINKGLVYLGEGDGTSAYLAFSEARKLDMSSREAKYGQVLADVLQLEETVDLFASLLFGEDSDLIAELGSQEFADPKLCAQGCDKFEQCELFEVVDWTKADCNAKCPDIYFEQMIDCYVAIPECTVAEENCLIGLGSSVQDLLQQLLEEVAVEMLQNLDSIFEVPDWSMVVPQYSFSLLDLFLVPSLTGENDLAEARLMNSISNGLAGILNILFAVDLDFNISSLDAAEQIIADLDQVNAFDLDTIQDILLEIQDLIRWLLNDPAYPAFLSSKDEQSIGRIQEAAQNFGLFFGELAVMIETIDHETDDQTDDAIGYVDENGNGQWDGEEVMFFPGVGSLDKNTAYALREVLLALKVNFTDGIPFPLNSVNDLLAEMDIGLVGLLLDLLVFLEIGEIDLAQGLRYPTEEGLRPALETLYNTLGIIYDVIELLIQ